MLDSIYTHYASRGFTFWGLNIDTPFPKHADDSIMDAQMRILGVVADCGMISTKPHVMEEVEIGYSDPLRTLVDVFYTQQMLEYEKTGNLICASDVSLDRELWFSYQGYKIGDEGHGKLILSII